MNPIRVFQVILLFCVVSVVGRAQATQIHQYDMPHSFKEDMRRLDFVADVLRTNDKLKVFLFGFNQTGQKKATAMNRLKKSRHYLINKHHISPSQIEIRYVGEQDVLIMHIALINTETNSPWSPDDPSPKISRREWMKLVPLESDRNEVEKILGQPAYYSDNFGAYKTKVGNFSVWYSKGKCQKGVQGLQWNVSPGKMTGLLVHLNEPRSLDHYVSDVKTLAKTPAPGGYSRYLYTSHDESFVYETVMRKDNTEFVYTIELRPTKGQQKFLCPGSH
jgi:hypothetical protein